MKNEIKNTLKNMNLYYYEEALKEINNTIKEVKGIELWKCRAYKLNLRLSMIYTKLLVKLL